jgi:hypothetical protein
VVRAHPPHALGGRLRGRPARARGLAPPLPPPADAMAVAGGRGCDGERGPHAGGPRRVPGVLPQGARTHRRGPPGGRADPARHGLHRGRRRRAPRARAARRGRAPAGGGAARRHGRPRRVRGAQRPVRRRGARARGRPAPPRREPARGHPATRAGSPRSCSRVACTTGRRSRASTRTSGGRPAAGRSRARSSGGSSGTPSATESRPPSRHRSHRRPADGQRPRPVPERDFWRSSWPRATGRGT